MKPAAADPLFNELKMIEIVFNFEVDFIISVKMTFAYLLANDQKHLSLVAPTAYFMSNLFYTTEVFHATSSAGHKININ